MSLLELIGNTPMVLLNKINKNPAVKVYAKLEGNNPAGSVKDRIAYYMFKKAIERGDLKHGRKIIEPTSGNTGIALAMVAAANGYEIELVMPENATRERVLTMEAYGAKVTLTPKERGIFASQEYAKEKVAKEGYYTFNQFDNPDNALAHYEGTGPEIWRDTNGTVTHFVSIIGTSGTVMGAGKFLKEKNSGIKLIGVQPSDGSSIPGAMRWPTDKYPALFSRNALDDFVDVPVAEAVSTARKLATQEGIFCGMSAGGAVTVALKKAAELSKGVVVVIIPDRGDRYLSTTLFKDA